MLADFYNDALTRVMPDASPGGQALFSSRTRMERAESSAKKAKLAETSANVMLRRRVLELAHDAHQGVLKMKESLRPKM